MCVRVFRFVNVLFATTASAYCDTSNYFGKSWWDVAIDAFAGASALRRQRASENESDGEGVF